MNAVALAALLLAGGLQDNTGPTISRRERFIYVRALEKFRLAEALLMKEPPDPIECAKLCGELIDDKDIVYRETKLRIENTDGSYGDWTVFAPLQLRGRAFLEQAARALAARDRKEAAAKVRLAVADLDESVRRNLKSSEKYLQEAKARSTELTDPDPEQKWREQFLAARTAENWKDLQDLMKRADGTLPPKEVEKVLQGFREEFIALDGSLKKLEDAGSTSWPRMREDATKLRQRAAAIAFVLEGRPLQQQVQALESRAARIAQFPGFVTLRIDVHPSARIESMTVGSRPFIREGKVVNPDLGSPVDQELTSPMVLRNLELDGYELELVHDKLGKRTLVVPKSALKEGGVYLIRGQMERGKTLELIP